MKPEILHTHEPEISLKGNLTLDQSPYGVDRTATAGCSNDLRVDPRGSDCIFRATPKGFKMVSEI